MYESTDKKPVGLEIFGRRALLAERLCELGITVAGFAEARTREKTIASKEFLMYSSGAARGQLGCEVWIARRYPLVMQDGSVKYHSIGPSQVTSFYSNPRILAITIHLNSTNFHIIAFHAPHAGTGSLRDVFWDELHSTLSKCEVGKVCLLGDANALLGSVVSASVGDYAAQQQNHNGAQFHKILRQYNLYVPSTFAKFTLNASVCTHRNNRIDYIALPCAWKAFQQTAKTCELPGTLAAEHDHFPTLASVCPEVGASVNWVARKAKPFDMVALRGALADPSDWRTIEVSQRLQHIAETLPIEKSPDCSLHLANNAILNTIVQYFPRSKQNYKANSFISDNTRHLARERDKLASYVGGLRPAFPGSWVPGVWPYPVLDQLRQMTKAVKKSVVNDRCSWASSVASNIVESDKLNRSRDAYKLMRKLEKKKPVPIMQLHDEKGAVVRDPISVRKCFQTKIANLTNGQIVHIYTLLELHSKSQSVASSLSDNDRLALVDLAPSLQVVESLCAQSKCFLSGGEDEVASEIPHYMPKQIACIIYPVMWQIVTNCSEPLAWLGGISHELLKAGAAPTKAKNFRMVLLADNFSKIYHKYLRSLLMPFLDTYIMSYMCGGFQKRGTDFASLFMHGFFDHARMAELSWAVLYLDVTSAFESLQRFYVFNGRVSDCKAAELFRKCNMPPEVWHEFTEVLKAPNAFFEAGVPLVLCKLIQAAHATTWYSFEGLSTVVLTEQGTKPGDPLGDIIFAFLICKVLKYAKYKFSSAGYLCNHITTKPSRSVLGVFEEVDIDPFCVNYADDNAFPIVGDEPCSVLAGMQAITSCVFDAFAAHLMHCAISPLKSAILLGLRGKCHRKAVLNEAYCVFEKGTLNLKVASNVLGHTLVPIVKSYKHVGFQTTNSISPVKDVAQHVQNSFASFCGLKHGVIGNKSLPVGERNKFAMIPVAKMLPTAGLWYNITTTGLRSLDSLYNQIYRSVYLGANNHVNSCLNNVLFYQKYPHKNVLGCIRGRRLRQYSRIVQAAPFELQALLSATVDYNKSYVAELTRDLKWLFESSSFPEELGMQSPSENPVLWQRLVSSMPNRFRNSVARAEELECLPLEFEAKPAVGACNCQICGFYCKSVHVFNGHMSKVHGHQNPIKLRVQGSVCLGCMKEHHNRNKLCHHLRYRSQKCREYYENNLPVLSPEVLEAEARKWAAVSVSNRAAGHDAKYSDLPTFRIPGPRPV